MIRLQEKSDMEIDRATNRGQATVEMALVMGILLLLIFGIIEVSRLIFINSEIDNAAREGAQYASLHPTVTGAYLKSTVIGPKMAAIDQSKFVVDQPVSNGCSFCPISVTVRYTFTSFVPVLNLVNLQLNSTSTKLIENTGN